MKAIYGLLGAVWIFAIGFGPFGPLTSKALAGPQTKSGGSGGQEDIRGWDDALKTIYRTDPSKQSSAKPEAVREAPPRDQLNSRAVNAPNTIRKERRDSARGENKSTRERTRAAGATTAPDSVQKVKR